MADESKVAKTATEPSTKELMELVLAMKGRIDELENEKSGTNTVLDKELRKAKIVVVPLTKMQEEVFGEPAKPEHTERMLKIFNGNAGFRAFARASDGEGYYTNMTVFVPEEFSGKKNDFRTFPCPNAKIGEAFKGWCEKIKSEIHREFTKRNEVPKF